MLSAQWYKILSDLWSNRTRTILIILSIAVGLFAVGAIASSRAILDTGMAQAYAAINPSSGVVRTIEPFDDDFLAAVRRMPQVAAADARRTLDINVRVNAGDWKNIRIFALRNYNDIRVNKIWPQSGAWPPPARTILIERAALAVLGVQVGDRITLETSSHKLRQLPVAGVVHDLAQMPAQFDNSPYGYISWETLEWLGEPDGYNELGIVARQRLDQVAALDTINAVKNKAEKSGYTIPLTMMADPGQLPLDDILQAILLLMGMLGVLALFLSIFLIVNTVSAQLTQQMRQIGVMKAVGARTVQILNMYMAMVLLYGCLALLVAIPLATVGASALSRFMAGLFNFDIATSGLRLDTFLLQISVGLLVPALSALFPLLNGLRLSAARAMNSNEGGGPAGNGIIDRLIAGQTLWFLCRLPVRPALLALRNTFRRKGRLLLTLITLTLGGAIFISVFNVRSGLIAVIDDLMSTWGFDVLITLDQPYRVEELVPEAFQVPGVTDVDVWLQLPTRRVRPDGSESNLMYLFAPRPGSPLVLSARMLQGRWLIPGDENALIISTLTLKDEPDLQLGDIITLKLNGKEYDFHIVGVAVGSVASMLYASYEYTAPLAGLGGSTNALLVRTNLHTPHSTLAIGSQIQTRFKKLGYQVSSVQSMSQERAESEVMFGIIISLLLIMAALLALVGGLGLMGTMSINVLERTREIGVLRAIGASNHNVVQVFMLEGQAIGLLSWALACLSSLPLSSLIGTALGDLVLGSSLALKPSAGGMLLWLLIVILLSALANYLPARSASRLTVREVLAYE